MAQLTAMRPRVWMWSLVIVGLTAFGAQADEPAGKAGRVFRAAAVTSNITPPLGELIVGGWAPYPAERIHDELYARCLVLDDGTNRLAIVVCDNLGIPRGVLDAARAMVPKEIGLAPDKILMAATHTHSATTAFSKTLWETDVELNAYQTFLAQRIADGLARAVDQLEPARIGWGSVDVPEEVFNRRWHMAPGDHLRNPFGGEDKVRMNPPRQHAALRQPAGPVDPQVCFISVQSTEGRPIALLANYSLHYVGGVKQGDVSADYFGVFADRMQQLFDADRQHPPFVGIMSNGTSGDINNNNYAAKAVSYKPYEKMREVANLVAERVYGAHQKIEFHNWVPLAMRQTELTLKVRKPTAEQLVWAQQIKANPESAPGGDGRAKVYAERWLKLHEAPDQIDVVLQALRIGDVAIAAIPFETFAEIGLEIKETSTFKLSFTIELAGGYYGYLPTPRQHEWGGYETWLGTNNVEIEASTKIVNRLNEMFAELANESKAESQAK